MRGVIVFVAKYFIFLSLLVAAIFWLRATTKEKFALGWRVVIGGAIAEGLAQVAGRIYYDTRPFVSEHVAPFFAHAPDNGFPSDHALAASFLGFVILLYSRSTGILLLVIAVLIGWARVVSRIHHPIDIIGSFVISGISVAIVQFAVHVWTKRRSDASASLN
jgi:undecaprenyl-diphosphatase